MAQFGGDPVNFPKAPGEANSNPRRPDPETLLNPAQAGEPENTAPGSQSEAARLARRGGQVNPPAEAERDLPAPPPGRAD